jgi:predicted TIM-barrel fold metal-dependent hydrolase
MSGKATQPSILESETIVDNDVHLILSPDDLVPYLDDQYKRRIKHTKYGILPGDGWDRTINGKIKDKSHNVQSPERIDKSLINELHVDYPILNTAAPMNLHPETEWAVELMRAHNDLLLDQFLDVYDNFKGLLTITTQDPAAAAEEIDRVADEKHIVGGYIMNTGPNPPLGDPVYDPIWKAAEDNGINIAFHGDALGFQNLFPRQNHAVNSFLPVHVLAHPWSHMLTMTSLITNGVVEKFPDLEFAFLEAGLTWVPYMMFRLNKEYWIRQSEAPLLERAPEEYIRDQMYFASQPLGEPISANKDALAPILDAVGTDSLLFATDYPHWDFDSPEELDQHLRRSFTEEERKQVLNSNAADLFDLNI